MLNIGVTNIGHYKTMYKRDPVKERLLRQCSLQIHCYNLKLIGVASLHCYTVKLIGVASLHCYTVKLIGVAYIHCYTAAILIECVNQ